MHRLRRRGEAWPLARTVSAATGLVGFAWATSGGLAVHASAEPWAGVAQHLVLVTVLPVGYALARPTTLGRRALPRRTDGSRGPREWLLELGHSRAGRLLTRLPVAVTHVVLLLALLHLTSLHRLVVTSPAAQLAVVLHLSVAGYLLARAEVGALLRG